MVLFVDDAVGHGHGVFLVAAEEARVLAVVATLFGFLEPVFQGFGFVFVHSVIDFELVFVKGARCTSLFD